MGYYTNYRLEWKPEPGESNHEVDENVRAYVIKGLKLYLSDDGKMGNMKWYDWEDDMRRTSARFPNILFTLHGEGEETGDLWRAYFLNGKRQKCKAELVYPPFNREELK